MKNTIKNSLFAVIPVAAAGGINVATTGGFAFSFIAKALMGLAIGATAHFALAGAASAALIIGVVAIVHRMCSAVSDMIKSEESALPAQHASSQYGDL